MILFGRHGMKDLAPIESHLNRVQWAGYLAMLVVAEILLAIHLPGWAIGLDLTLVLTLLLRASPADSDARPLLLALTLAPLVRIVALALPSSGVPIMASYLLTSLPLLLAALLVVRAIPLSKRELGVALGNPLIQLAVGLLGVPVGAIDYFLLRPLGPGGLPSWPLAVAEALLLVVATGFVEEFIFRGVLQAAAIRVFGGRGLIYVSAVYASLHLGYLSVGHELFVFAVGLSFALMVARTRSLLGVGLAHGAANIVLFMVAPRIAGAPL